jgi:hypothetical protein
VDSPLINATEAPSQARSGDCTASTSLFAPAAILRSIFSFAGMLGMGLIAKVFYTLRSFPVDGDLWWHIKIGQGILATHHFPMAESFSFTAAGQHWRAYEWLGEILLAFVYQVGGLSGLGLLLFILGSLFALALYYYTTLRCGNPKAGFLATALLLNLATAFNLRPQMLGYLFLIFTLIILERFRQGKHGAIWLLPMLMLVWVNTHGLWIIGLGTIAIYLVSGLITIRMGSIETQPWSPKERRQLTMVFLLSLIAIVITPYGTGLATYPFQMSSSPVGLANISEWQPMTFFTSGDKLFLGLLFGFLAVQVIMRPKWRLEELGLFLFGTMMTFQHARFLSLFAIFFAPVLVLILARWLPKYDRAKEVYALNAAIMIGMVGVMAWYFPTNSDYLRIVEKKFPIGAVQYLNTHSVPGPLYNSNEFGGYLLWARGPEHKVFIDGRSEIYEPAGILSDQVALINLSPGSLALLQKYKIQSCMLWRDEALATVLAALPDWQRVYMDDTTVLFIRQPGTAISDNRLTAAILK